MANLLDIIIYYTINNIYNMTREVTDIIMFISIGKKKNAVFGVRF